MRNLLQLLFLLIFSTVSLQAQELDTTIWVANGPVGAFARIGNTLYLGGQFNHIGPNTGGGAVFEPATGKIASSFPRINGKVELSVSDGKGGWFLAGDFTKAGGLDRKKIIHILADNTVDSQWNLVIEGMVTCMTLSGNILYLGGSFYTPDAPYMAGILAINASTGSITNWKTELSSGVLTLAVAEGKIYAGGNFTLNLSQNYQNLVSFDLATGQITAWNPKADRQVKQILVHQNIIYVHGWFSELGGEKRAFLGSVSTDTGLATTWNPSPDASIETFALGIDELYLSGTFNSIAGEFRNHLAAIDLLSGTLTEWKPNLFPFGLVTPQAISVAGNTIYLGGDMPATDQAHGTLAALDKKTGEILSWNPFTNGPVHTLSFSGNKLFLGGSFSSVGGEPRNFLAAIDATTGKVLPWNPRIDSYVSALATIGNTLFIGGSFQSVGGKPRRNFAAVNAISGTVSNLQAYSTYPIYQFLVYNNKLFIRGMFSNIGGEVRQSIAVFDPSLGKITGWNARLGDVGYGYANCMAIHDNKLYVGGSFNQAGGEARRNLAAFDIETGNLLPWNPQTDEYGDVYAIAAASGKIYTGGGFKKIGGKAQKYLAALDPITGAPHDWDVLPDFPVTTISPAGDSTLFVTGYFESIGAKPRKRLASIHLQTGLVTDWKADIGIYPYKDINPFINTVFISGKSIYVGGTFRSINDFTLGGGFAAFGVRPEVATNIMKGNIFNDTNTNCVKGYTESPLPNLIVVAQPGAFYTSTDSSGNFELAVPSGKYTLSQVLPQLKGFDVSQLCPANPSYSIEFSGKNEIVTGKDFANKANIQSFLSVDIASDRRRRCFRNQTTVNYRNEGFASAAGVEIKVVYPEYVIPISSSIPWKSRQGNTLVFDLGTVLSHSNGTISITDSVACGDESIRGLTQCTKAFITPRNQLAIDNSWDQSSLALFATCKENGFVGLTIKNMGNGNMADSTDYRIFLDAKLVFSAKCKLNQNDSLVLEVPVNGRTIRLEADQAAHYPTDSKPTVTLEGCGSSTNTPVSKGFVNQLPQDDAESEVAISCMPILDSYDPNDKAVSPAGVTASDIIRKQDILEYTIRFQNTGNDIAYTVVIEDELSEYLDLSTFRMGASSHTCSLKISGEGNAKITWTFNNINLPDSTSNEVASHGFVQFSIAQKKDNSLGNTITNQAYITFDYNSPIVTNMVSQTIGEFPSAQERIDLNICDGTMPSQANAGENIQILDVATTQLRAAAPAKGNGYWKLLTGSATISNPQDPQTLITNLGVGSNVFEWSVSLCDQQSWSRVTVERVVIPSPPVVEYPAPYCDNEFIKPIKASGENIEWFSDQQLQKLLSTGETYHPLITRTDTFYVTQTMYGYRSSAQMVILTIKAAPAAPQVPAVVYYCKADKSISLTADGENIEWYADKQLTSKIGNGSPFIMTLVQDTTLYAIQRIAGCRSAASAVTLKAGIFAPKELYIANVITPNGDEKNESFNAPEVAPDSCLGQFQNIQIFNRYGKRIYESRNEGFSWNGSGVTAGVYYYVLTYSGFTYSGTISVLY